MPGCFFIHIGEHIFGYGCNFERDVIEYITCRFSVVEEHDTMTEDELWQTVVEHQGEEFYTVSGLTFSYQLKKGRDGSYNRELIN